MRIGIVLHPYGEDKPAGLARTIFELSKGMLEVDKENEYVIYLKKQPRMIPELPGSFRVEVLGGGRFGRFTSDRLWLEKLRWATKTDVYIFNTPMMPLFWRPPRSIVLALDFAYWYLAPKTIRGQASRLVTFLLHKRALCRADSVVAISEATKKDLIHLFQLKEERIKVIYCGFKRISIIPEKAVPLPSKFFFFAGIIKPRKNVFNIVKAFHLFLEGYPDFSLVIGGNGSGEYYESIRNYVRDNNLEKEVLFTGHLNDGELSYVYKRAQAFVFPTLIEGFGYPVLEAMDCGIPAITSNQSSLAEVGGNGSALLVNPYDTNDIAQAMLRIVREPELCEGLKQKGMLHVASFSWSNAARKVLSILSNSIPAQELISKGEKTIFLTMSRGILIRNFFHSGIVGALVTKGFRIVVIVPFEWGADIIKEINLPNIVFEFVPPSPKRKFASFFDELSKGAIFNPTVHVRYKYRLVSAIPIQMHYFVRMVFFAPLKFLPVLRTMLRFLERVLYPEKERDYLFSHYQPCLVFKTTAGQDFYLTKGARRFGVPVVEMPKSWDNASKLFYRMKTDYVCAWGPFMAHQLVQFQKYAPEKIVLTGAPQFDFYWRDEYLKRREDFCGLFGFDPSKKIILYASGGNFCDEEGYLFLLKKYISTGALKDVQMLIRPHVKHRGDIDRFLPFDAECGFVVDKTGKQNTIFRDNWDTSVQHSAHLLNSLRHSDVCVTIGSTMTLDAAACGTPSININFDTSENVDPHRSTKRLFQSDYLRAVTNTGGTWLVHSEREFLSALQYMLKNGKDDPILKQGREKMVERFLYKNDGRAAERVVQAIEEIAKK